MEHEFIDWLFYFLDCEGAVVFPGMHTSFFLIFVFLYLFVAIKKLTPTPNQDLV